MPLDASLLEVGPANVYYDNVLLGFMGDDLAVTIATEATPLTGAQTGSIPQDKVVSGGSFRVTVPFKEISLQNFARAIPNAILVTGATSGTRVDFVSQVGKSMRALAKKLEIRKFRGGSESTDPKDFLVIPFASPVDGEVTIPFHPTEQRVITATFEAWPDASGRWAFAGDETVV